MCRCIVLLSLFVRSFLFVRKQAKLNTKIEWDFSEDRKSGKSKPHKCQWNDNQPRGMRNGLRMN